jgi:flagellar biogenesis protein FliO
MKRSRWIALALLMGWSGLATFARADSAPAAPSDSFEHRPIVRDGAAANSPQAAVPSNPTNNNGMDATRVLLALAGVVGLIAVLRVGLRRIFPGAISPRATRAIKILSRSIVSPKQHLLLIQVGKRLIVVGDSGAQLNPLCEITDGEEMAEILAAVREESATAARRFDLLFGRARKSFDEEPAPAPAAEAPAGAAFDPTHEINDPALCETRNELSGLSDKVRELARQLQRD